MPSGAAISVECEDCTVRAKVTYCIHHPDTTGGGEWHIGIQTLYRPWELVAPLVSRTEKNKMREQIAEDAATA